MKTNVRDSSLAAWEKVVLKLRGRRAEIVKAIGESKSKCLCDFDIGKAIGKPVNYVTQPRTDLLKAEILVDIGRRRCEATGTNVHHWRLKCDIKETLFSGC